MDFNSKDADLLRIMVIKLERRQHEAEARLKKIKETSPECFGDVKGHNDVKTAKLLDIGDTVIAYRFAVALLMESFPQCWKELEDM